MTTSTRIFPTWKKSTGLRPCHRDEPSALRLLPSRLENVLLHVGDDYQACGGGGDDNDGDNEHDDVGLPPFQRHHQPREAPHQKAGGRYWRCEADCHRR